jgi:hypothetical protein
MRIETVGELIEKLEEFDDETPVFITYQDVAFNIEEINESDCGVILASGLNADFDEDK